MKDHYKYKNTYTNTLMSGTTTTETDNVTTETGEYTPSNTMKVLIDIVKYANQLIMNVYNDKYQIHVKTKKDLSPLTRADLDSSNYICQRLSDMNDYPIICEETKLPNYNIRKDYTKFWLVDPLDGTTEFITGNGEFTVNIALIELIGTTFTPTMGIVSIPVTGTIYFAELGKGAYKLDNTMQKLDNTRQNLDNTLKLDNTLPITPPLSPLSPLKMLKCNPFSVKNPINIICSRSHLNEATTDFFKQFKTSNIIQCGSSIKFMKICENEAHVYPRLQACMEWDIGASDAILREAGGQIQTLSGNIIKYNTPTLKIPSLVAYGKEEQ
jgi:3'(2'), 5'-bisphosphate nucleotidase